MPRRHVEPEEIDTQRSVRFASRQNSPERDIYSHPFVHMLTEDLHLGVMPISPSRTTRPVRVVVEPDEPRVNEILRKAFPTHRSEPHDVTESVSDFIAEVVHVLAYYGTAYYEIVYFSNENDQESTRFELESL